MNEDRNSYLALIEGVINRLASTSAAFKGISITLFAGVLAVVFSLDGGGRSLILAMTCIGLMLCAGFDCWYFSMEIRYRKLYTMVLDGTHPIDFDMRNDKSIIVKPIEVLKSKAVWPFYGVIVGIYVVLLVCSIVGVL